MLGARAQLVLRYPNDPGFCAARIELLYGMHGAIMRGPGDDAAAERLLMLTRRTSDLCEAMARDHAAVRGVVPHSHPPLPRRKTASRLSLWRSLPATGHAPTRGEQHDGFHQHCVVSALTCMFGPRGVIHEA